jgi:hypothetical protein
MTTIRIHSNQTTTTIDTEMFFYEVTAAWYIVIGEEKYNAYPECDNTGDCYLTPFDSAYMVIEHAPTIINGKGKRQVVRWLRDDTTHITTLNGIDVVYNTDLHAYVGNEEESTVQTENYDIPLENLDDLTAKLETLNRKAKKYNFHPVTVSCGEKFIDERMRDGVWIKTPMQHITVSHELIKLGVYNVAAFIDHTMENVNIVHTFASLSLETMETLYKTTDKCDHCKKKTARNSTFILIDNKDHMMQVGKSCLKLYTGLDASQACAIAEYLREVKDTLEEEKEEKRSYKYLVTKTYLYHVFSSIAAYGFISKSVAEMDNKYPTSLDALDRYDKAKEIDDTYKGEIETVLQWVRGITVPATNEYLTNLKNLCSEVAFPRKKCGYVASLPSAWLKALEEKRKADTKVRSTHLKGEEKDKVDLNVKILKSTSFTSDYGLSNVTTAMTVDGQIVKWFGGFIGDKDDVYRIVGTIKKFDYDTFLKEDVTVLTRVTEYKEKPVKVSRVKKETK